MWTASWRDFEADDSVRAIVLRGAGDRAFVSGADISQFERNRADADAAARYAAATEAGRRRLAGAEKPTIAMIRGFCLGGGLGIAMTCDLRFAQEGSEFGIPAARLGIAYNFDNLRSLVQLVGPARAKDILVSGRRLPAGEAYAIGLVDRVLPAEELEAHTRAYAEQIAANAPLSIRASKLTIDQVLMDREDRDHDLIAALGEGLLRQRGLQGGACGVHGKAPSGVPGPVERPIPADIADVPTFLTRHRRSDFDGAFGKKPGNLGLAGHPGAKALAPLMKYARVWSARMSHQLPRIRFIFAIMTCGSGGFGCFSTFPRLSHKDMISGVGLWLEVFYAFRRRSSVAERCRDGQAGTSPSVRGKRRFEEEAWKKTGYIHACAGEASAEIGLTGGISDRTPLRRRGGPFDPKRPGA